MSVECPAGACDYMGTMDAVEGHIGGSADALHEGVAVPDVRAYLNGEEGGGEASEMPPWAWVAVALVVALLVYLATSGNGQADDQPEDQEVEVDELATQRVGGL